MDDYAIVIMVMSSIFIVSGAGVFGYWLKLRQERRHLPKIEEQLEKMRQVVGELRNHSWRRSAR